uniref:YqaJ viral recombinase domain-containing protein n=1 Tax=Pelagomonas calceolata TaxID=35677 RepID=A0A7S4E7L6_9STRA
MRRVLVSCVIMAALALVPPSVQLGALRRGERLASMPSSTKPAPKNRRKKRKPAQKKKRGARPRGNVANVHWRAIPARALRSHPLYLGLPPARDVCGEGGADLGRAALFRQDAWRWDALHAGRLTGSRVAAVCGLLESDAANTLRIPKSLAGHGRALRAASHLRERPDASLLAEVFRDGDYDDDEDAGEWCADADSAYAYDWAGSPDRGGRRCGDAMAARLAWGKTQEGIGMLAAVNALEGSVAETGLLCAEAPGAVDRLAERWPVKPRTIRPAPRKCPVGASPDGLIIYDDGALDVLEIKSVAPFVRGSGNKTMELYDRGPHDNLAPWIVPHRA